LHTFRGFRAPFLEFFNRVESGRAARGAALRSRTREIVEDTADSDVFRGSPILEVLLDAGARAVQSTPLIATSGQVVGMLSTHCRVPHRPSANDLHVIDYFARRAAMVVEWRKNDHAMRPGKSMGRDRKSGDELSGRDSKKSPYGEHRESVRSLDKQN
jgi:GAF domain